MGLFHSHASGPDEKELHLQSQLRQAAAPYEPAIMAALQWLIQWALPECELARFDSPATGYQWQLRHTRDDGTQFVDVTLELFFTDRHPDQPESFVVDYKTPGGLEKSTSSALTREDLMYAIRRAVASH